MNYLIKRLLLRKNNKKKCQRPNRIHYQRDTSLDDFYLYYKIEQNRPNKTPKYIFLLSIKFRICLAKIINK